MLHRAADAALAQDAALDGGDGVRGARRADHVAAEHQALDLALARHLRVVHARGLRLRAPAVIAQHGLADIELAELLKRRLGETLALAVDLVVAGGQTEGEHLVRAQLTQRLCVDEGKLPLAHGGLFDPCRLKDHIHAVYSSPAAAPPFLCALSSGHRSSGT